MTLDISAIINQNFEDYSAVLSKRSDWMEPDYLDKKLLTYTMPHSDHFFNPLRLETNLFHFKRREWFNFFPVMFLRDGLLSILHFFYEHPTPNGIKTILILPDSAKNLIPSAWHAQCLLYEINRHPVVEPIKPHNTYLVTMLNPDLYELKTLRKKLEIASKQEGELLGLFTRQEALGEEKTDDRQDYDYDFFKELNTILGDKITLVNWSKVRSSDLSHSAFLELNDNDTWYNDSTVAHSFLAQGGVPLEGRYPEKEFDTDSCMRISSYHYYRFSKLSKANEKTGIECWEYVNSIPAHVFVGEKELDRKIPDYREVFLCTPEFESLTRDLISKYC